PALAQRAQLGRRVPFLAAPPGPVGRAAAHQSQHDQGGQHGLILCHFERFAFDAVRKDDAYLALRVSLTSERETATCEMLTGGAEPVTNEVFSVLDDDGNVLHPEHEPTIAPEDLLRIYRGMLLVRLMDERMLRLQRQGRLGFYMTSTGEEATHFGGAYPLRDSDWIFPSYREPGAAFWRGYGLREFICQLMGNAEDPIKGRQMPVHHSVRRINYVSISSPVGTQIPQAVGVAHAAQIRNGDDVALVYFGEGGTSTGAFHVALNFAGVFKLPVIFFCRNNGWAISTARERQTAARTFAAKAVAYGLPGVRVDGNDVLAIVSVMNQALAR